MAANGADDFQYAEGSVVDLQEAEDVARRAMLGAPQRLVSEELEMPLTAIPESDDSDADGIAHIRQPAQRVAADATSPAAADASQPKPADFSFSAFGAASGRRSPSPSGDAAPFEPMHDRPESPSLLPQRSGSPALPPRAASPGLPPRSASPGLARTGSGGATLARTGSWSASPGGSDPASPGLPRSSSPGLPRSTSPGLTRSGSSSYLNPDPFEPLPPDPVAEPGEAERLPALPAAAAMPVQTMPLYRPPSAEALELLSATNSGSLPLPENQPHDLLGVSQPPPQPDATEDTATSAAADASEEATQAPLAAEPALQASSAAEASSQAAAAEAELPATSDTPPKPVAEASPKPAAKSRRSVPKLPVSPPLGPPAEDAFVGLPDDVLHGPGEPMPVSAPKPPSSVVAEPATSAEKSLPLPPQPEVPAAAGATAAAASEGATELSPSSALAEPATSAEKGLPVLHNLAAGGSSPAPPSPPEPAAAAEEPAAFAPQTPEVTTTEAVAPPPAAAPAAAAAEVQQPVTPEPQQEAAQPAEQQPLAPMSRDNQTPFMERKLRNLQAQDWEGAGGLGEDTKPHKTRSQREREEDLQSWKHIDEQPISVSAAKAVQEVDAAPAPLGQDFKVHKSQLEQDVEAAARRERTPPPATNLPSYMRPTANSVTRNQTIGSPRMQSPSGRRNGAGPGGQGLDAVMVRHQSALEAAKANGANAAYEPVKRAPPPTVPGLDELLADTGRIQRAREEAALKHSELFRPAPKKAAPKVPGLEEVLVITKSQLELEKEAAAAANGGQPPAQTLNPQPRPPPGSPADKARRAREAAALEHARRFGPAARKQQEADGFGGKGLGEVIVKHKSALQRKKEESEAAGANSPTAPLRAGSRSEMLAQRQGQDWGGRSLAELQKPHKSRLVREQEEWATKTGKSFVSPRKKIQHMRQVMSPGEAPHAPSFMRDTMSAKMKHIDSPEPPRTPTT